MISHIYLKADKWSLHCPCSKQLTQGWAQFLMEREHKKKARERENEENVFESSGFLESIFSSSPPHPLPTVASGGWLGERQSSCRLQVSRVSCASICTAHDSHSARGSRRSRARISLARNSRLEPQLSLSLAVPRLCALNVIDIQTLKNMNESIS